MANELENLMAVAGQNKSSGNISNLFTLLLGQILPLSRSERQQNAFNQRMAEEAFNREVEFYDSRQSAPAMVQQYKEAGINPALVAGYAPSNPPSSQAASGSGGSPALAAIQLAMEMKMRNKELDLQKDIAKADIDLKESQAGLNRSNTTAQDIRNKYLDALESGKVSEISTSIEEMKSNISLNSVQERLAEHNIDKTDAEAALSWLNVTFSVESMDDRLELAHWQRMSAEYTAKFGEARANRAQEYVDSEINKMAADAFLSNASAQQVTKFVHQYFDDIGTGQSLFQTLTVEQVEHLRSQIEYNQENTRFTFKNGKYIEKMSGKVEAETNYVEKQTAYLFLDKMNQTLGTAATVVNAFKPGVSVTETHTTNSKGFEQHTSSRTTTN